MSVVRYWWSSYEHRLRHALSGVVVVLCSLGLRIGEAQAQQSLRTVILEVTQVTPASNQSSCDDWNFYMRLSLNGDGSGDVNVPNFWDHFPCSAFSYNSEAVSISHSITTLACEDSVVDFVISLREKDDGIFDSEDDQEALHSFSLDVNDPASPLSGCVNQGGKGGFCWTITVNDEGSVDSDGDGLLDDWENNGVDIDCDGEMTRGVDLFLPEMGVNQNHKDLLVEVNWFEGWEPALDALEEIKEAFAAAPITAGGSANPDGTPGINLVIDAGNVLNDVGAQNTIGGRVLGPSNLSPNSAEEFHALMDQMEASNRIGFFRQIVIGPVLDNGVPAQFVAARAIGNDRVQSASDTAATLMHELGHTLGLGHGGPNFSHNCQAIHLSVMNYRYGAGIPFETFGLRRTFIDFSPSKIPDDQVIVTAQQQLDCPAGSFGCNRRLPLLGPVHEAALDESLVLAADNTAQGVLIRHLFEFTDPMENRIRKELNTPTDWNQDGMFNDTNNRVAVNIDVVEDFGGPEGCQVDNNGALSFNGNRDEWSGIILPPGRGVLGSLADPNAYSTDQHEPFTQELVDAENAKALTTDLAVAVTLEPVPVNAESPAYLTATVTNLGTNPGFGAGLKVQFPAGVLVTAVPEDCQEIQPSSLYECTVLQPNTLYLEQALRPGASVDYQFTIVPGLNETGNTRNILASVDHDGEDPVLSNNTAAVTLGALPEYWGFDDPSRPWVLSYTGGSQLLPTTSGNVTGGDMSASLDCGYTQFESPTFDTGELDIVGDTVVVDVWMPAAQNASWGELQLWVDVPSAELWNVTIGLQALANLPRDTWSQVEFSLPADVVDVLLGDYPDARLRLATNVPICGSPVLLDSVRFGGTMVPRSVFHTEGSQGVNVVSSSVLTFDQLSGWSSFQTSVDLESSLVTQGSGAISFAPGNWSRVESRTFSTTELTAVSQRLSFDVYIPDLPADYYWLGQLNVFLDCPSAGLWNSYVGYQPLQILFDNEFNRVEFTLPAHVVDVLEGDFNDCRFGLEFSTNPTFGPFVVDNGGFVLN